MRESIPFSTHLYLPIGTHNHIARVAWKKDNLLQKGRERIVNRMLCCHQGYESMQSLLFKLGNKCFWEIIYFSIFTLKINFTTQKTIKLEWIAHIVKFYNIISIKCVIIQIFHPVSLYLYELAMIITNISLQRWRRQVMINQLIEMSLKFFSNFLPSSLFLFNMIHYYYMKYVKHNQKGNF